MTAARPADILRLLEPPGAPDGDLLALFARTRDASAFAELVRRHGPLVLGVCRRVTGNVHDAEDAFQASFLVLARKAGSLANAALVGNWLYGVAFRVARRAKRAAARRRAREVTVPTMPDPPAPDARAAVPGLGPILDEELAALAAHYRDAIVLCDLRGLSREAAAEALGVPEGTLSSRLANGRKKLAARLARRGVALPAAGLSAALGSATASVPAGLLSRTCETVTDWAATGTAPAALASLTKGGFAMRLSWLFGSVLALGIAGAVFAALPADEPPVPPKPSLVAADDKKPDAPPAAKAAEAKPAFGAPKLARTIDVPALSPVGLAWNPKGTHLALSGAQSNEKLKQWQPTFRLLSPDEPTNGSTGTGAPNEFLLAPTTDGTGYVTVLREDSLISGRHRLAFWAFGTTKFGTSGYSVARTVSLDPVRAFQYALAADEKTYRAVLALEDGLAETSRFEVVEAGTKEGEPQKSLLKLDAGTVVLSAHGERAAHLSENGSALTVYDVDAGKKLSACALEQPKRPAEPNDRCVVLSPDGSRVFAWNGRGRAQVFDTASGKPTAPLEGAEIVEPTNKRGAFSGDGRLFACYLETYREHLVEVIGADGKKKVAERGYRSGGLVLAVWNTETGKLVKSWKSNNYVLIAFNPVRPVLALAEQNGENLVRVGFWDFAADAKK